MRLPCGVLAIFLHLAGPIRGEEVISDSPRAEGKEVRCPKRHDSNGLWSGSLHVGKAYSLQCNPGYEVDATQNSTFTAVCPPSGRWDKEAKCVPIDGCRKLKNKCGPMGFCDDLVDGYRCVCEEGYALRQADDGTDEWVCGQEAKGVCDGHTCGAYGVCVDLTTKMGNFDSGNTRQSSGDTYKCTCADGFQDNGTTCLPLDCGALDDKHGEWVGSHHVGGEYTLRCNAGAFVFGSALKEVTMTCPAHGSHPGKWNFHPKCMDAAQEARDAVFATTLFWLNAACALLCVTTAAVAAGLTTGMLSLGPFQMEVLMHTRVSEVVPEEQAHVVNKQKYAKRLLPVITDRHWLMVTLLLLNSIANEALPIFLDRLVPAYVAVLLSVTAVLIFGEILPTAYFTGPDQVQIASRFVPVVRVLRFLFAGVALPIARLLDVILGKEETELYSRAELRSVLRLHHSQKEAHAESTEKVEINEDDSLCPCSGAEDPVDRGGAEHCVLEKTELTVMTSIMDFRDCLLGTHGALEPLLDEQVVYCDDCVTDVANAVVKGTVSPSWVLVSRNPDCSCAAVGGPRERSTPLAVSRSSVLGVVRIGRVMSTTSSSVSSTPLGTPLGQVKIKELTLDWGPQDLVWLESDQSALTAFSLLAQKTQLSRCPALGLIQASSRTEPASSSNGKAEELQDMSGAIMGFVTLESLAALLWHGLQETPFQSGRPLLEQSADSEGALRSIIRPLLPR